MLHNSNEKLRPICHLCGEPGGHGSVDECIVALRKALVAFGTVKVVIPEFIPPVPVPKAPEPPRPEFVLPPYQVLVRRLQRGGHVYVTRSFETVQQALVWIAHYGKDKRYWIEAKGHTAFVRQGTRNAYVRHYRSMKKLLPHNAVQTI